MNIRWMAEKLDAYDQACRIGNDADIARAAAELADASRDMVSAVRAHGRLSVSESL